MDVERKLEDLESDVDVEQKDLAISIENVVASASLDQKIDLLIGNTVVAGIYTVQGPGNQRGDVARPQVVFIDRLLARRKLKCPVIVGPVVAQIDQIAQFIAFQ